MAAKGSLTYAVLLSLLMLGDALVTVIYFMLGPLLLEFCCSRTYRSFGTHFSYHVLAQVHPWLRLFRFWMGFQNLNLALISWAPAHVLLTTPLT
jgi:hypothetical protein